jgi:hypothetical protein
LIVVANLKIKSDGLWWTDEGKIMIVHTLTINVINACLSFYLFLIFAWWWSERGNAPSLHSMVCGVMFGMGIQYAIMCSCLWRSLHGEDMDEIIATSWIVAYNKVFVTIPLAMFCWYVTKKIFFQKGAMKDD